MSYTIPAYSKPKMKQGGLQYEKHVLEVGHKTEKWLPASSHINFGGNVFSTGMICYRNSKYLLKALNW